MVFAKPKSVVVGPGSALTLVQDDIEFAGSYAIETVPGTHRRNPFHFHPPTPDKAPWFPNPLT